MTKPKPPPHLTEKYIKPEGEPDGFKLPPPEPSKKAKGTKKESEE